MKAVASLFLFIFLTALSSCSEKKIVWKEINQVDELSIVCEAYVELGDSKKLTESLNQVAQMISQLRASQPKNLQNQELVNFYLSELEAWSVAVTDENVSYSELANLAMALHPVVENLITAAGLPHYHLEGPSIKNHEH